MKFALVIENTGNANAFDVLVKDLLPTGFKIPDGVLGINLDVRSGLGLPILYTNASGGVATSVDLFGSGIRLVDVLSEGAINSYADASLLGDGSNIIVITYDLQVDATAELGETIANVAQIEAYASIEGGANLVLGAETPPEDDGSATTTSPTLTATALGTGIENANNSATQAVIGETAQYQVTLTLPEGTLANTLLIDELDLGLAFVSLDSIEVFSDGSPTTDVTSSHGTFANPGIFAPALSGDGLNTPQTVTFDLGDIANANADDLTTETLVVTYTVQVTNTAANQGEGSGTKLANAARLEWGSSTTHQTAVDSAQTTDVIEPALLISRSFISDNGSVGDGTTYTVTLAHAGGSQTDAFDVALAALLPGQLTVDFLNDVNVTHSSEGNITNRFELAGGTLQTQAGQSFDLAIGETVTITVEAVLNAAVESGDAIDDVSTITWTSLDGVVAEERTGTDGSGGLNNYFATAADTYVELRHPTIVESRLLGTGISNGTNAATEAVIGETAQLQTVVSVPAGTTLQARVESLLDLGLQFVSLDAIEPQSGGVPTAQVSSDLGTFANPALFSPEITGNGTSVPQSVVFDLGNLSNADSDETQPETLVLTWTVRIANAESNQGESPATTLNSQTRVTFSDGSTTLQSAAVVLDAEVQVIEPGLQVGQSISESTGDAGDSVTYTFVVSHTSESGAAAYDVAFQNPFPVGLDVEFATGVSVTHSTDGDIKSLFELAAGTVRTVSGQSFDLAVGETVTVAVTGTIGTSVKAGEELDNSASVSWTSLDGNQGFERTGVDGAGGLNDYVADAPVETFTADSPASGGGDDLVGTGVTTANNASNEAVIGETVQFESSILLPEGITLGAELVVTLDLGLVFVGLDELSAYSGGSPTGDITSSIDSLANVSAFAPTITGDGTSTPQVLTFTLGDLTNANTDNGQLESLVVTYTVQVANVSSNQSETATSLSTHSQVRWVEGGVAVQTSPADSDPVNVLEPTLQVVSTIEANPPSGETTADAGDTVTLTSVISHADVETDAYGITYGNMIPIELSFDFATDVTVTHSTGGDISHLFEAVGNLLRIKAGQSFDLLQGETVTVVVSAAVTGDVQLGDSFSDAPSVLWTSLPGDVAEERTGEDGLGGLNNYESAPASATLSIAEPTVSGNEVLSGSLDGLRNSSSQLAIGETVQVRVTLALPEGELEAATLIDQLDLGLVFVSLDNIVVWSDAVPTSDVTSSLGSFGTLSLFAPSITGDGVSTPQSLTFDLGTLLNSNTDNGLDETLELTYTLRAANIPGNQGEGAGTQLASSAQLHWQVDGAPRQTAAVARPALELVEPVLTLVKLASDTTPHLGDTITVSLQIEHAAASDTEAFDLRLIDLVPEGATLDLSSIQVIGANIVSGDASFGESTTLQVDLTLDLLAPGTSVSISYDLEITSDPSHFGNTWESTATLTWTSLPGASAGERDGSDPGGTDDYQTTDAVNLTIVGGSLSITNGNGLDSLTPGQHYTFELSVTNDGTDTATGVVVMDTLPVDRLQLDATDDPGNVTFDTGSGELQWNVGSLAAGVSITLEVTVTVVDPVPTGATTIAHTATVSHAGVEPVPADNSASDSDALVAGVDLVVVRTNDTGGDIQPGDSFSYELVAQNDGDQNASGVVVVQTLDLDVIDPTSVSTSMPGSTSFDSGTGELTWTIGSLSGAGGSQTLTVTVGVRSAVPSGLDAFTDAVVINDDSVNGPDLTPADNTAAAASITLNAAPDYVLTRTNDAPGSSVVPGQTFRYELEVTNTGNQDGTGVVLTNTLAADILDLDSLATNDDANVTWDSDTELLTWNVGNLAVGQSRELTLEVTVRTTVPSGVDEFFDSPSVNDDTANGADPTPANNSPPSQAIALVAVPDYSISRDHDLSVAVVEPGDSFAYEIRVRNDGAQGGTGVQAVATLAPDIIDLSSVTTSQPGSVALDGVTGTLTWTVGDLAAGEEQVLTVNVTLLPTLAAGIDMLNTPVSVSDDGANGTDATPGNNSAASESITINAAPDYTINRVNDLSGPLLPGQTFDYTITISNEGNQDGTGVEVRQLLPVDVLDPASVGTDDPANVSFDGVTGELIWTPGGLAAGDTLQLEVTVTARYSAPAGVESFSDEVHVTDDTTNGPDPSPGNNTPGQDEVLLEAVPDYEVTRLSTLTDPAVPGQSFQHTITVTNNGDQDGSNVVVHDVFPLDSIDPATVTTDDPANTVFDSATGILTWNVGDLAGNGDSATLVVNLSLRDPAPAGLETFADTVLAEDDGLGGLDPTPNDNSAAPISVSIQASPDYEVRRTSDAGSSVVPGQSIHYDIQVINHGNQDGSGVIVTHHLPLGIVDPHTIAFDGPGSLVVDQENDQVLWIVGDVPGNGGTVDMTLTVQVRNPLPAGADDFSEFATITDDGSSGPDGTPGNNATLASITQLDATPDYSIQRNLTTPPPLISGTVYEYEIEVSNVGGQGGTGVEVRETVPTDLLDAGSISTSDPANVSFDPGSGELIWRVGNLSPGSPRTLTIFGILQFTYNQLPSGTFAAATVSDDGANGPDTNQANNATAEPAANEQFKLDPLFLEAAFPNWDAEVGGDDSEEDDNEEEGHLTFEALMQSDGVIPPAYGSSVVHRQYGSNGALISERALLDTSETPLEDRWLVPFSQIVIQASSHDTLTDEVVTPHSMQDEAGVNVFRQVLSNVHGMRFYSEQPTPQSVVRTVPTRWLSNVLKLNDGASGFRSSMLPSPVPPNHLLDF